jgi:hypothetical protein
MKNIKNLLRIAAVLSFLFPFIGGVWCPLQAAFSPKSDPDAALLAIIGCFLVGNAFFVGAILLFAAEKLSRNGGSK